MLINFHFPIPESLHTKLVQNGPLVSEYLKVRIIFSDVNGLGPRSENDIDLQFSLTFINSISCLHVPSFGL